MPTLLLNSSPSRPLGQLARMIQHSLAVQLSSSALIAFHFATPLHAQDDHGAYLPSFTIESSVDGGLWRPLPTSELRMLSDGKLWLPFEDQIVSYRLRPNCADRPPTSSVPGTPDVPTFSPLGTALAAYPTEGAFLNLAGSSDLNTWRAVSGNSLAADGREIRFPGFGDRGFWRLEIKEKLPDPKPVSLSRIPSSRTASFQANPFLSGPGSKIVPPDDLSATPKPRPGPAAFNRYIFEERVHQLLEGDVKGYGVVIANEKGFQSTVSGGLARDPNDGVLRMTTFRPGNIGSCAKLYTGVALMQLLQQQGPDLQTALDQTIEDYLPPRWLENATVLASASSITFRMLLDHTSGIGDLSMNGAPENLMDNPDYYHFSQPLGGTQGCFSYANENYRIMTYLIPALAEPNALLAVHTGSYQKSLDEYLDIMELAYGLSFENYMKNQFFPQVDGNIAPSADPANDYPPGSTALMYTDPTDTAGLQWSQKELTGHARGQGGYWSSAQELARFMISLMYTEDLLTAQNAQLVLGQTRSGCNFPADLPLINNGAAQHAGFTQELGVTWWRYKPGRQPSSTSPGGVGRANAMFLPYGWVCSSVVNSDSLQNGTNGNSAEATGILGAFYDATRDLPVTISREAMTETSFVDTASYLRQRHMAVKWLDLYDIAGQPYVNAVFGDASNPVAGQIGMNAQAYQDFIDHWVINKGFAVQQVESYLDHGKVRYAAIITEESRPEQRAYHGLDYDAHAAQANAWKNDGFVPTNISVVSVNGTRRYTGLYERKKVEFEMRTLLDAQDYDNQFEAFNAAGFKVVSLNAYRHEGQRYYAAIWHKVPGGEAGIHEANRDDYRAADADQFNGGRLPTIITGVDSAVVNASTFDRHRFGAVWR